MSNILVFNKPYQVLSQFNDDQGRPTLAKYISMPKFYAAGRLDFDSEGLMVLTNDGKLQQKISNPKHKLEKTYWVQSIQVLLTSAPMFELWMHQP